MVVQDEELLATVLHDLFTQMVNQPSNCRRLSILVVNRHSQRMLALICKEHFETAAEVSQTLISVGTRGETVNGWLSNCRERQDKLSPMNLRWLIIKQRKEKDLREGG